MRKIRPEKRKRKRKKSQKETNKNSYSEYNSFLFRHFDLLLLERNNLLIERICARIRCRAGFVFPQESLLTAILAVWLVADVDNFLTSFE
jgi:hypothetical protein